MGVKIYWCQNDTDILECHVKLMQDEILRYYFGEIR